MRRFAPIALAIAFLTQAGCETSGNLVFFTNTSFGLDVSNDPSSSGPRVVIGYKRQEGVLNPVYQVTKSVVTTEQVNPTTTRTTTEREGKFRDEAFSVIAKYQGSTSAGDTADMSNAQWFATGPAALELAKAPGIAGAVSGNAKIAEAAALQSGFLSSKTVQRGIKVAALHATFAAIEAVNTPEAALHLAKVAAFATKFKKPQFSSYTIKIANRTYKKVPAEITSEGWKIINEYLGALEGSVSNLQLLVNAEGFTEEGAAAPDTLEKRTKVLLPELMKLKEALSDFEKEVFSESSVLEGLNYYADLLKGK